MTSIKSLILFLLLLPWSSFAELEPEPEQQRKPEVPKIDLLQGKLNTMMQNTASWLDSIGDEDSDAEHDNTDNTANTANTANTKKKQAASANGYFQLSWLPKTGDLDNVDAKFKVYLNLPKWNDKLALVIDNDDEDERLLDYETDHQTRDPEGINVAVQYIKQFNQHQQVKNRIGVSRKQLYLRSEMQFNWKIQDISLRFKPRIDYLLQDGWGPSVKGVVNFPLEKSTLSLSATWQHIQSESRSRRKVGFYHIKSTGREQLLVTGVQYNKSNNKLDISNENVVVSTRYRNLLYKSWMYFEVEPFIEFNERNDFRREAGIALNLISYYGN